MLKLFFWFRYLCKRRIVLLSIAAVALSVSLLIVVASLFTGFINAFERSAVDVIGDVILAAPSGVTFDKHSVLIERLAKSGIVEAATPTLTCDGLLHVGAGNVRGVTVWGIEPGSRTRVTKLKDALVRQKQMPGEPSFDVPGVPDKVGGYVGIGIVADPNERTDQYDLEPILKQMIGQQVLVTTGTMSHSSSGADEPRRVLVPFNIADIVFTGVYQLDESMVCVPIGTLQRALYPDAKGTLATSVNIKLKPDVNPDLAVTQIRGLWHSFAADELGWTPYLIAATRIATAQQMQHQYVVEIRKQMGILLLVFGVISFSVVVLVFCIFYMIVRLKRKDVAIMKSCGAPSSSVAWIFLGFGVAVGVMGAALGTVLGYVITANINIIEGWIRTTFGLKLWQSSVYMFDKIPNVVDWNWALLFAGLSIVAAALGALLPAALAAGTRPVEVLRYE
jgi:lipoprotein-releasing system permease protein